MATKIDFKGKEQTKSNAVTTHRRVDKGEYVAVIVRDSAYGIWDGLTYSENKWTNTKQKTQTVKEMRCRF